MTEDKYLYKFYFDYGRMGELEGLFVSTEEEVKELIGEYVDFGECLGKHSQVDGEIEEDMITKVDIDSESVKEVSRYLGSTWSGYNPFDYVNYYCPECNEHVHADDGGAEFREEFDEKMCDYCYQERLSDNQELEL